MDQAPSADGTITVLLARWAEGDDQAFDDLVPLVYARMRHLADLQLRGERPGHTLQPTDLLHEVWIRLAGVGGHAWADRRHFLRVAARVMRRVLVDHARAANALRRPSPADRVALDGLDVEAAPPAEILVVHEALERLAEVDARQARLVELRYFGGLTVDETAEALDVSVPTVVRDWRFARAWLRDLLEGVAGGSS